MLRPHLGPGFSLQRRAHHLPSEPRVLNVAVPFAPELLRIRSDLTHFTVYKAFFHMMIIIIPSRYKRQLKLKGHASSFYKRSGTMARLEDADFLKIFFNYSHHTILALGVQRSG